MMEVQMILNDMVTFLDHLDEWTAPQPYPKDLLNKFNSVYTQPEPYGVVLIIAPWNYPFQLVMLPLLGAIAAGESFKKCRKHLSNTILMDAVSSLQSWNPEHEQGPPPSVLYSIVDSL